MSKIKSNISGPTAMAPSLTVVESGLIKEDQFVVPDYFRGREVFVCYINRDEKGNRTSYQSDGDVKQKVPCESSAKVRYLSWSEIGEGSTEHLCTFEEAMELVHKSRQKYGKDDGLSGVMVALDAPEASDIAVIDVDDCVNDNGQLNTLASELVEDLDTEFWEISPSVGGLHCWIIDSRGTTSKYKEKGAIECYSENRCVTFTGRSLQSTSNDLSEVSGLIEAYQKQYNDKKPESEERNDSVDTDDLEVDIDNTDLSEKQERLVDAMTEHNEKDALLYEDGSTAWDSARWDHDRSKADQSLFGSLQWWRTGTDKFEDVDFSDSEIIEVFLTSDLARREKCQSRPKYLKRTLNAVK